MDGEFKKIELDPNGDEFGNVARDFFSTLDSVEIVHIYSIQHPACWNKFKDNVKSKLNEHHSTSSNSINESCGVMRSLFHGTRKTSPDKILEDPIGFNIKFTNNGMWGKGLYFAVNASYSKKYEHKLNEEENCMFLAKVFVGNSCQTESDEDIVKPPTKFHSTTGETKGSQVFILYENCLAYPSYLIVYRTTKY